MKTILFVTILVGFLTTCSYAQNIDCRQLHVAGTCPGDNVRHATLLVPSREQVNCAGYTQGTSFISACPDSTDISGSVQFTVEGNYPMACTSRQRIDGTIVVTCHPKCLLMDDPVTGRQWYKCPDD